jgi:hypothetical protein
MVKNFEMKMYEENQSLIGMLDDEKRNYEDLKENYLEFLRKATEEEAEKIRYISLFDFCQKDF